MTVNTSSISDINARLSVLSVTVLIFGLVSIINLAATSAVELYLKVVFKGKGGVSTGRLLAAVNRPH